MNTTTYVVSWKQYDYIVESNESNSNVKELQRFKG